MTEKEVPVDMTETEPKAESILVERLFDTPKEFKAFFDSNKETLEKLTTTQLNKLYKVRGYIIRRNYGGVNFRHNNEHAPELASGRRLTRLEDTVDEITTILNKVLDHLHM